MSTRPDARCGGCAAVGRSAGSPGGGGDATGRVTGLRGATGDDLVENLRRSLSKKPTLAPPFRLSLITRAAWRLQSTNRPYHCGVTGPLADRVSPPQRVRKTLAVGVRLPTSCQGPRLRSKTDSYGEAGGEVSRDSRPSWRGICPRISFIILIF
jgi:hypothetical protein